MLNKNNGKWFTKKVLWTNERNINIKLTCIPINSGMGITGQQNTERPTVLDYLEAKAKAYKAEQANRKTINNLRHFSSALLERTSEVFKPITTNQDNNQELLAKTLEQEQKAIEKKPEKEDHHFVLQTRGPSVKTGLLDQQEEFLRHEEGSHHEYKETLSKIECIDLINRMKI